MMGQLFLLSCSLALQDQVVVSSLGLRVPAGFEVVEWSGPAVAADIQALCAHPKGGVIVSGPGYVRWLRDLDQDGRAENVTEMVPSLPAGAMGIWCEGNTLFVTDSSRLLRYIDRDDDGRMDGEPAVLFRVAGGGEHALHGIRRGRDGWLYLMAGDGSGIVEATITSPTSPVEHPVGGCLLRWSPDMSRCEVVADGFRNAYDFDFSHSGDLFAFDSDNERCVGLPWYEPTRVYHVEVGGHHGWLGGKQKNVMRLPPYFADVTPPLATLGRGSPTGVCVYRHHQFPELYRRGLFVLDWTFGKIHYLPLLPDGGSYRTEPTTFIESVGTHGFAPTDIDVDSLTGDLWVSVGGRGTRGAVYRVRWSAGFPPKDPIDEPSAIDLDQVEGFRGGLARGEGATSLAGARRFLELAFRSPESLDALTLDRWVKQALSSDDARLARAGARLEARRRQLGVSGVVEEDLAPSAGELVWMIQAGVDRDRVARWMSAVDVGSLSAEDRLTFTRAASILAGDLGDAAHPDRVDFLYRPRLAARSLAMPTALLKLFPTGEKRVDREISRLAGQLESADGDFARRLLEDLRDQADPVQCVHELIVLTRLRPPAEVVSTDLLAEILLGLDEKFAAAGITLDTNGPPRLKEIFSLLANRYPAIHTAIIDSKRFGTSGSLRWCQVAGAERKRAAQKIKEMAGQRGSTMEWNHELIDLLSELPDIEVKEMVRGHWEERSLRVPIANLLANEPVLLDFDRLVEMIDPRDRQMTERMLDALESIPPARQAERTVKLARSYLRLARQKGTEDLAERMHRLLTKCKGDEDPTDRSGWERWLAERDPGGQGAVEESGGWNESDWPKRISRIDPTTGRAAHGKELFKQRLCAGCHGGARAIGPDLAGVGRRYSREDLFRSIVEPDRDIPDRYRGTRFITVDGQVLEGVVVYEAADGLLIQQANLETNRLQPREIESREPLRRSLMPTGLLDRASDQELSDLESYLRSL
jgi:putative membrane-bound dehydrogenase-like protein